MGAPGSPAALQHLPWPQLWQGRTRCSLLHTGGSPQALADLLQLWQRWRLEPARCRQLQLLLVCESADQARAALQTALAAAQDRHRDLDTGLLTRLQACWPPLTPNLHPLDLEPGRVELLLCLAPLPQLLPRLRLQADVLWLQAVAAVPPPQRLRLLKALARLSAPQALACGAAPEPALLAELRTAGFQADADAPSGQVWVRHRPFARPSRSPRPSPPADRTAQASPAPGAQASARSAESPWPPAAEPLPQTALVIGAGIAGAAAAQALARQGLAVTVLDRQSEPASETSGNPAALFHGTVNPDDGPYARLFRAAALVAQREYAAATSPHGRPGTMASPVPGAVNGLLRMQSASAAGAAAELMHMVQQLQRLGLPADYVHAVDATQASRLAGLVLSAPAWHYPGGGWIDPGAWVRQALQTPGIRFQGHTRVQTIRREADLWQALDAEGRVLAQAQVLVLACALASQALLPEPALALHWPLRQTRGQVTQLRVRRDRGAEAALPALKMAVTGDGYALPLPVTAELLCGATRHAQALHDHEGPYPLHRHAAEHTAATELGHDHQHNLQRLQRLTGLQPEPGSELRGRVGWRLHTDDRLPMAGPVPEMPSMVGDSPVMAWPVRLDQARQWPRRPGLFVLTALGARGVTLAPLLGRLVAAQATGAPWPMEQDLVDAVDPVRWALRAARLHQSQVQAWDRTQTRN